MRFLLAFCALLFAPALSLAVLSGTEPGQGYCYGVGCPCGNDDPTAGCVNSTGVGGLLTASGSTSVDADDLKFSGTQLPPNSVCLLVMASSPTQLPFKNGLLCLGSGIKRLQQHQNSNQGGTVLFEDVVTRYSWQNVILQPGDQRYFQIWHRDSPPGDTPCGEASNLTNGYTLTFTP